MRRRFFGPSLVRPAAFIALVLFAAFPTSGASADDEASWTLLKKPGRVALLRHARAPETPPDRDVKFNDCKTQRNLDDAGRAQARRLSAAFRKHGLASADIYSSRYCRAKETGKLLGDGGVRGLLALDQVYAPDVSGLAATRANTRAFIGSKGAKPLTILVSHVTNIQSIAGVSLDFDELAIVHMQPSGELVVASRINVP
jgi:phosphohistidine phosphatase SixA